MPVSFTSPHSLSKSRGPGLPEMVTQSRRHKYVHSGTGSKRCGHEPAESLTENEQIGIYQDNRQHGDTGPKAEQRQYQTENREEPFLSHQSDAVYKINLCSIQAHKSEGKRSVHLLARRQL